MTQAGKIILWSPHFSVNCLSNEVAHTQVLRSIADLESSSQLQHARWAMVLAGLPWDGRKLSDFYGFEILYKLRMEYRLMCPIAVCSFMAKEYLGKRFPIISDFSDSHLYVQLPASKYAIIREARDGAWLDEPRLNHVIVNCCDPLTRILRHLTHGKGFQVILNGTRGKIPRNFLSDCANDLNVMANYLKCPIFGAEELTTVNAFTVNLDTCIKTDAPDAVLGMRDSLRDLVRLLAGEMN